MDLNIGTLVILSTIFLVLVLHIHKGYLPWTQQLGIVLDFNAKTITINEIILQMINVNHQQDASTLCVLKLNNSLAMQPKSTHGATKCATWILDAE
jgi:hypothetical protein